MAQDLSKLSTEELGKLFPIIVSKYNADWPVIYQLEKEKILKIIPKKELLRINHIGSTAIPGIKPKPTIDILLEVSCNFNKERCK